MRMCILLMMSVELVIKKIWGYKNRQTHTILHWSLKYSGLWERAKEKADQRTSGIFIWNSFLIAVSFGIVYVCLWCSVCRTNKQTICGWCSSVAKSKFSFRLCSWIDSTLPVINTHIQTARSMVVVNASRKIIHIHTMAKQKHWKHASTKIHFICKHKYTRRKKKWSKYFLFYSFIFFGFCVSCAFGNDWNRLHFGTHSI